MVVEELLELTEFPPVFVPELLLPDPIVVPVPTGPLEDDGRLVELF